MERLWRDGVVRNESGMFAGSSRIDLLFPAESIARVSRHGGREVFAAGRDFRHEPGDDFITRTENSRIPYLAPEALRPAGDNAKLFPAEDANAVGNAVGGGNLRFDNGAFFADNQVDITYLCAAPGVETGLDPQTEKLPKFREKLARRAPLKITLIGDSISEGFNATKFVGVPPFSPSYMEQAAAELGANVALRNRAVRGTGIQYAVNLEADYLGDAPDLLVIAYGMNNFSSMPVGDFIANIAAIIAIMPSTQLLMSHLFFFFDCRQKLTNENPNAGRSNTSLPADADGALPISACTALTSAPPGDTSACTGEVWVLTTSR